MHERSNIIRFGFWPIYGLVGWRWNGLWTTLLAPWRRPLFSERYGYCKVWPLAFGFRVVQYPMPKMLGDAE